VSQAEQSLAVANDQYVASLYRHNMAKLSLARSLGRHRTTRVIWEESSRGGFNPNSNPIPPEESTEVVQPQSRRRGLIVVVLVVLALVAAGFWWRSTFSEDTDDAQINGHLIQVSSRISGQVIHVDVAENQVVKAGDPIAELDPSDYKVAVENAEAALASAQANAAAAQVNVPITTVNTGSNLSSASADVTGAHASVSQAEQQFQAARARIAQAQANDTKRRLTWRVTSRWSRKTSSANSSSMLP